MGFLANVVSCGPFAELRCGHRIELQQLFNMVLIIALVCSAIQLPVPRNIVRPNALHAPMLLYSCDSEAFGQLRNSVLMCVRYMRGKPITPVQKTVPRKFTILGLCKILDNFIARFELDFPE